MLKNRWPGGEQNCTIPWFKIKNELILRNYKKNHPILWCFQPQCPFPRDNKTTAFLISLVRSLLWSWRKIGLLWILNRLETVTTSVPFLNPESQPDLLCSRSLSLTLHRYEKKTLILWKNGSETGLTQAFERCSCQGLPKHSSHLDICGGGGGGFRI